MKNFSLDYFISKFSRMEDAAFGLSTDANPCDAWEWMDCEEEGWALYDIVKDHGYLILVNDGTFPYNNLSLTIKGRIIKFLLHIKRETALIQDKSWPGSMKGKPPHVRT